MTGCTDHDLCQKCYATRTSDDIKHDATHEFFEVKKPSPKGYLLGGLSLYDTLWNSFHGFAPLACVGYRRDKLYDPPFLIAL
jgi:hypothetical protein